MADCCYSISLLSCCRIGADRQYLCTLSAKSVPAPSSLCMRDGTTTLTLTCRCLGEVVVRLAASLVTCLQGRCTGNSHWEPTISPTTVRIQQHPFHEIQDFAVRASRNMQVFTDMPLDSLSGERSNEASLTGEMDAWVDFGTFDYDLTCDFDQADLDQPDQPHSALQTAAFHAISQPETSLIPGGNTKAKTRVSLACVPCRSRHSKCDAIHPTCSQCRDTNRNCEYAKSRRNRNRLARGNSYQQHGQRHHERIEEEVRELQHAPAVRSVGDFGFDHEAHPTPSTGRSSADISDTSLGSKIHSKMMKTYYTSFHRAHPLVLPSHAMEQRLHNNEHSMRHLLPAMHFVAWLYEAAPASRNGQHSRIKDVMSLVESPPSDGFTTQAFLLLAIAVHSNDDFVYAREILDKAVDLALAIGMNNQSFARDNGEGDHVLEESWRRTWWLLYMTDGIFSRIRHCPTFSLHGVKADVDIPCEEALYHAGVRRPCHCN